MFFAVFSDEKCSLCIYLDLVQSGKYARVKSIRLDNERMLGCMERSIWPIVPINERLVFHYSPQMLGVFTAIILRVSIGMESATLTDADLSSVHTVGAGVYAGTGSARPSKSARATKSVSIRLVLHARGKRGWSKCPRKLEEMRQSLVAYREEKDCRCNGRDRDDRSERQFEQCFHALTQKARAMIPTMEKPMYWASVWSASVVIFAPFVLSELVGTSSS